MMTKVSRREQNVLIAGGTLVFILLFVIYLLQPKWEKNESDQAALIELQNKIDTLKVERANKLKEKPETVESLKNQIRSLRSQLPVTKETAGFMNFIITAADTAGLNLMDISAGDQSKEPSNGNSSDGNSKQSSRDDSKNKRDYKGESTFVRGTTILPVTVRVLGSYKQVRDFTMSLESLKRLNHIKSIIFARDELSGILMCEIALDVYSWEKGDPALNDPNTIPKSKLPGKIDPYDSVGYTVYQNLSFNLRWDN